MILEHYSNAPLEWPPRDYEQSRNVPGWGWPPKPTGLWLSVRGEDDWPTWCRGENFREDHLTVCTVVTLTPEANILVVSGEAELRAFDEEYGAECDDISPFMTMHRIDWEKVAEKYDGIVIAPYVWSCRLPTDGEVIGDKWVKGPLGRISDWYYPWDCASGCIWNGTKAISAFEVISEEAAIAAE